MMTGAEYFAGSGVIANQTFRRDSMIDYDAIRAADERQYQAFRATLDPIARAVLEAAAVLISRQGRSLTQEPSGRICGCTWNAHAVRHRLGATDPEHWFFALLALERTGDVSVSLYASPGEGAEGDAEWRRWQDEEPLENWGERHLTSRGVLALAGAYGITLDEVLPDFFCEECTCGCGRQSARPLGGFCVLCLIEYDLWDGSAAEAGDE
jgi:hypothetical protein